MKLVSFRICAALVVLAAFTMCSAFAITSSDAQHLSDPVERAAGNPDGTRLGLARKLARSVGGHVTARSWSGGRVLVALAAG
jgi:hypothetical protein